MSAVSRKLVLPAVGPRVPQRGNAFSRWFGYTVLRLLGWRVEGLIPDQPKMVLIGGPHTSNMDGVIGLATLVAMGLDAGTMIKDTAFKGALGPLLRWLGAIPINRRSAKGVVEQTVDAFKASPQLLLLIAPEGTRAGAEEWKRGFHHIASGAQVPVLPAACNYRTKVITFGPAVLPSGNYEADLGTLQRFIAQFGVGRHPERTSKPICELQGLPWRPQGDDKD
ncbi:MAG TPA: lysophospholipid acyltransferase family protein [Solimonas sp.]|nr:lysophospholipid acyltransferase family protein [Solimonas sp.]